MNNSAEKKYKYCTFWYPTIFHRNLSDVSGNLTDEKRIIRDREVHDDCKESFYLVSIALDSNENLVITSQLYKGQDDKEGEAFNVTLIRMKPSRNGFCQYRYNPDEIPANQTEQFEDVLEKGIYHIAKEFYHTHEADSGKDSALRGRITDYEVNLSADDNEHLIGFLENYARIFANYAKNVSDANARICEVENLIATIKDRLPINWKKSSAEKQNDFLEMENMLEKLMVRINQANRYCENALIEYTYYNTLLNSRYNKSFHHQPLVGEYICQTGTAGKDEKTAAEKSFENTCRIKALNAENAIRYIQNIQSKNQNRLHNVSHLLIDQINKTAKDVNSILSNINIILGDSEHTSRQSKNLSWFGILIGLVFGGSELIFADEYTLKTIFPAIIIIAISICFLIMLLRNNRKHKEKRAAIITPLPNN